MSSPRNAREINICRITQMMSDLAPTLMMMRLIGDQEATCPGLTTPYTYILQRERIVARALNANKAA